MTAPFGSSRAQLDAAVADLSLQVDRDTVLQARAALLGEVERLRSLIHTNRQGAFIGLCGADPVSADAAPAFNERIAALLQQCWQYTIDMESAAHTLDDTARGYGYTDAEIAASFPPGR